MPKETIDYGTNCICPKCKQEQLVRLFKGRSISQVLCENPKCCHRGLKRWTQWDQQQFRKKEKEKQS